MCNHVLPSVTEEKQLNTNRKARFVADKNVGRSCSNCLHL